MEADGSGLVRLIDHSAGDAYPSWSLDASRIAFESDRNGNCETYLMNTVGPNRRSTGRKKARWNDRSGS